jgi:hypothetical protein
MIVFEIIHEIIGNRGIKAGFDFDMIDNNLVLDIDGGLVNGDDVGNQNRSHICKCEAGESGLLPRGMSLPSYQ